MSKNNRTHVLSGAMVLAAFLGFDAQAVEIEGYGSLRLGAEYVDPDNAPGGFDSYTALRDAYSRVGVKATHNLNEDWSVMGQVEIPLDLANLDIHSPYDDNDDLRIGKIQVNGPLGTLWYGRGWMAYYNYIAYPVDYFSSYYSGYATFTSFRLKDTLAYISPGMEGFQLSMATSKDNGNNANRRNQLAVSYTRQDLVLAAGIDEIGGTTDQKIVGVSASYNTGPWYFAIKYEEFSSDISGGGWAADGTRAVNGLAQWSRGKHSLRAMLADVDNYGERVFHAGWDYRYRDDVKFFAEYYREEQTAAIADSRRTTSGGTNSAPSDSGGQALTVGVRYDF